MEKYRLIEYNPNTYGTGIKPNVLGSFDKYEEAAFEILKRGKDSPYYYRIEAFEESIMDKVKSYEDACAILYKVPYLNKPKKDLEIHGSFSGTHGYFCYEKLPDHIIALRKLETITAALNEGWKPDWEDEEQKKWYVVVGVDKYVVSYVYSSTAVPSRLYFKSRELAEYAAKQFGELYKQLLIERF